MNPNSPSRSQSLPPWIDKFLPQVCQVPRLSPEANWLITIQIQTLDILAIGVKDVQTKKGEDCLHFSGESVALIREDLLDIVKQMPLDQRIAISGERPPSSMSKREQWESWMPSGC